MCLSNLIKFTTDHKSRMILTYSFILMFNILLVQSATISEVRLTGGAGPWEGTVEVYTDGSWGTLCDYDFDLKDARVVCRMLGFGREIQFFPRAKFGQGVGKSLFSYLSCSGNEQNIGNCGYRKSTCSHGQDVGISCVRTNRLETTEAIRLIGGTGPYEGTVELNVNGQWGTICDTNFDKHDADVVCRMAGYTRAIQAFSNAHFGHGNGSSMLYNVHCSGHEDHLDSCGSNGWFSSTCTHDNDAGVACLDSDRISISQGVQFVGGTGPNEGTVEINVNGEWGTICGSYFDMNDAEVICRMAGYSRALQAYSNAHFGPGNGSVILSTLKCSGNENIVDSCGSDGWYKTGTCTHSTDAGVVCLRNANKYTTEGIRLVGGAGPFEGRVELNINGQWGTICDNSFDLPDAEVICKMAGYSSALQSFTTGHFGVGAGPIYLDSLQCSGHERHLDSCASSGLFKISSSCQHSDDVGVACLSGNRTDVVQGVRLVGGFKQWEGRVELLVNGQWGTICGYSSGFDIDDAKVICRMAGLSTSGKVQVFPNAYFGRGTGPVLLSGLTCAGHEDNIDSCGSNGWYKTGSYCGHQYDVGVSCPDDNPFG
ncbi:deleted in malignant brain tumors 1 protein-like isoform X1 [Mytilus trossulus]|uniref:deleted in malignant brain tumors 1 protein-like isoform X1 n=2 Tax=Mytilus trossulus TaxID=6551 RepID=UPI003003FCE6